MYKKILFLVLLVSFFSVSFCFAFDINECLPQITEWWNSFLNWVNTIAIPWLETNFGLETRQEFEKEFTEALADVPVAVQNFWNWLKGLFD
jgi:hypothetical protein